MKRKLTGFTIGFAAVLFTVQILSVKALLPVIGLLAISLLLLCVFLRPMRLVFPILIGAALAVVWLPTYEFLHPQDPSIGSGEEVSVVAVASEYSYAAKSGTGYWCRSEIKSIDGKEPQSRTTVSVFLSGLDGKLSPGDQITFAAKLLPFENSEDFMAFTYYKTRYIDAQAFAEEFQVKHAESIAPRYYPAFISQKIKEKIDLLFGNTAGLLRALLTGDRNLLTTAQTEELRVTGMSHVVAVSGMHVAFLVSFAVLIFGKRKAPFLAIPLILCFGLMIGPIPSIMRALFMQCVLLIAPLIKREADGVTSLSGALLLLLILNPYSVLDVGLQLSFGATLGLLLYGSRLNLTLMRYVTVKNKLLRKIAMTLISTFAASLCAMIFTTPIVMITFGTLSLISPLANVLALWSITFVFIVGILAVVISFVIPPLGAIIAIPVVILGNYFLSVTHLFAKIPYAIVGAGNPFLIAFLIYAYAIFIWLAHRKGDRPRASVILATGFAAAVFCVVGSIVATLSLPTVTASVLDVGQGLSVLVETHDETILVDCGSSDRNAAQIVYDHLMRRSDRSVDALIVTHLDADHINGVESVLARLQVKDLYLYEGFSDDVRYAELSSAAEMCGTNVIPIQHAKTLEFESVTVKLFPVEEGNDIGLAAIITRGENDLVITGDNDTKGEEYLMKWFDLPNAEYYVVGHHGSKTSSSFAFLSKIDPELAIISVGANNSYGHPSEDVLGRLIAIDAETLRTDQDGTISIVFE